MGEFILMPFQKTLVWEASVPRKEAVERLPLPADFMKIEGWKDSNSERVRPDIISRDMVSIRVEIIVAFVMGTECAILTSRI
jgi:hypothetical protein